jgi:hypothetical protein
MPTYGWIREDDIDAFFEDTEQFGEGWTKKVPSIQPKVLHQT